MDRVERVARAICRTGVADGLTCVMEDHLEREKCTPANCMMFDVARAAIAAADAWQDVASAPKEPIDSEGFGPVIVLRVGNFVVSDQWQPGLPKYPLQSHWRNWPFVQPRRSPSHWAHLTPLPEPPESPDAQ